MKLTPEQCEARATALEECAEHLGMNWTDDPIEREQGILIEKVLRVLAGNWWKRADQRRKP